MEPKKQFIKTFESLARFKDRQSVFSDFVRLAVLEISQTTRLSLGWEKDEADEKNYLEIVQHYEPNEVRGPICELFSLMLLGLEQEGGDWLGRIYSELEFGNPGLGQFFTPYPISLLLAKLTCFDKELVQRQLEEQDYITLCEPACGAGGMILAFAEEFRSAGFEPGRQLFVQASDLSSVAASMCYVQLSLCGIPALVLQQNTITQEVFWERYTPTYFLKNWPNKLRYQKEKEKSLRITSNASHVEKDITTPQIMNLQRLLF